MPRIELQPWPTEKAAASLDAALEADDLSGITAILGEIARARGMRNVAKETGLGRESLYKSLAPSGNPEFATVLKVLRSVNLQLRVTPRDASLPDVRTAERPATERTTA